MPKKIIINSFDAGAGDSFHIYFPEEKFNMLIDGGYNYTYDKSIKPILNQINERGEILDLLVITHMCNDHIGGIIKLIKENGSNFDNNIIKIGEIWCNTFFNSYKNKKEITLPLEVEERLKNIFPWEYVDNYMGNVSSKQLNSLSKLLLSGGYLVNSKPIVCDSNLVIEKGNIKYKILSPDNNSVNKLVEKFIQEIPRDIKELEDFYNYELSEWYDRFMSSIKENPNIYTGDISTRNIDTLSKREFVEDKSISNRSSLAFTIEYGGKKMVFLGDSVPSTYFEKLKEHYPDLEEEYFELIKLSHHGSKENTTLEFFKTMNSKNYLISTNGNNHSHPDQETIAKMVIGSKSNVNIIINCVNIEFEEFVKSRKLIEKYGVNIMRKNHIEL